MLIMHLIFPKNILHKQCYQSQKKIGTNRPAKLFGEKKFNLNCSEKVTNQTRTKRR